MSDAADEGQFVGLEALSWTTSVAESPASHLGLDLFDRDLETGRQSLHDDHEGLAMGFARREIPQHPHEATGRRAPPRRRFA